MTSFEVLRLNVLVACEDERRGQLFHVDTFDLYSARARGVFCRQAAEVLGLAEELVARDLGRVLLVCEERAEDAIRQAQTPEEQAVVLSDAERERRAWAAALAGADRADRARLRDGRDRG